MSATAIPRPRRPRLRSPLWGETRAALILVAPFFFLLLIAGIIPMLYGILISLDEPGGGLGISAYQRIISDFRFANTFIHILTTLLVWIPIMMVGVVGLALLVYNTRGRFGSSMRFIYFMPGALAGIANIVLWLFLLNPGDSPLDPLWSALGFSTINEVAHPSHMPWILTGILFMQGAGTWLVIMNGGLNGINEEVMEAATVDGAGKVSLAWHVQLPIIRPWIGYMALLNVAYGFQLFIEVQVLGAVTSGMISPQWSPNQLSYTYAFQVLDTPAAAAMAVILLGISLAIGLIVIERSGLFNDADAT
ncbi:MAG: sugar ABC transporter permease [Chloroflexota bacterium]|nr:sugar ABC transporter permease [Chloroflexota bacterium]